VTAAGFLGLADAALESRRLDLWARRRKPPGRVADPPAERPRRAGSLGGRWAAPTVPRRRRRAGDGTGE